MAREERAPRPPDPAREHPLSNAFYQFQRNALQTAIRYKLKGAEPGLVAQLKADALAELEALKAQLSAL